MRFTPDLLLDITPASDVETKTTGCMRRRTTWPVRTDGNGLPCLSRGVSAQDTVKADPGP
ncbi:hypothetical protein AQI94_31925 [Streptomyces pseudovenezuelae]|uniref:Uncharacterized protein n=1 Tax=Streptomyces pseudovenezuelae TaxID=67350 RepID=A0A101N0Q5_9ACTN|nr:hypothetical protein AQI94_31925 [Streptomyces pseudovenezuelae]